MTVEEQEIEVEGLPTRYLMAGEGPPLLLLHGVGDNALDWRWVMPALAPTHCVYAPRTCPAPVAVPSPAPFTLQPSSRASSPHS